MELCPAHRSKTRIEGNWNERWNRIVQRYQERLIRKRIPMTLTKRELEQGSILWGQKRHIETIWIEGQNLFSNLYSSGSLFNLIISITDVYYVNIWYIFQFIGTNQDTDQSFMIQLLYISHVPHNSRPIIEK